MNTFNRVLASAFADELEKISANTTQLMRRFLRAGGTHTSARTVPAASSYAFARMAAGTPKNTAIRNSTFVNPQVLARESARATGKPLSPAGRVASAATAGMHELFERSTPMTRVSPPFSRVGHANPAVLAKERRMFSRLEGPGAEEARNANRKLRQQSGEADVMRDLVGRTFKDPRAVAMWERGEVSGAMRRKLERDSAAKPEMVSAALTRLRR